MSDEYRILKTEVVNFPKPPDPYIKKTTPRTVILDPTKVTGPSFLEISGLDPARECLIIQVIDAACAIVTESPVASPDTCTIALACQGRYLPASTNLEYRFSGADAFWLNSLTGNPTRVTITREYRSK